MTTTDRLLFVEEVAEMIRRSPASVRFMIHAGTAPKSAKLAGRRMFRESDVLAWIDEQFEKEAS
ncbi:helix-turn-helix domain-containing protein [Brevibacterium sp. K11IcPPYGO002]|uniref:helix-turn-helix transcriptional regulator n=1 Tax=Brevibacterium sp. K11IcPPYGO002 TaxID=3058837 RepID=UPI003D81A2E7